MARLPIEVQLPDIELPEVVADLHDFLWPAVWAGAGGHPFEVSWMPALKVWRSAQPDLVTPTSDA